MKTRSRGFEIGYATAGERGSPALVLIHGILQSAARWAEVGYLDAFADCRRVVAVDLLGHGESDKPYDAASYTSDGQLADLLAVLEADGVDTFDVWGYSGGVALATALAARVPDRVGRVVLGGVPPNLPIEARQAVFGGWIEALRAGDWVSFWAGFLPVDPVTQADLERRNDPQAVAAWLQGTVETAEVVGALASPILVYMGDEEPFFDAARDMAGDLGAAFASIPGRGHAGAFQDLAAVTPVVRGFLDV